MTKTNLVGILLTIVMVVTLGAGNATAYAKSANETAKTGTAVSPVKVTPVAADNRIQRMGKSTGQPNRWMDSGHSVWNTAPTWIRSLGFCIRRHESHHDYNAENPTSTAAGAYQFLDGTWQGNAKWTKVNGKYVARGYARASDAPDWVQDAVFIHSIKGGGIRAWHGTWCPGT